MISRGGVYCAIGRKYVDHCVRSAVSLRRSNPSMGAALFTDEIEYAASHFEEIFTSIEAIAGDESSASDLDKLREGGKLPSLKVLICDRSPFEQSLSIDGDTLVLGDLTAAFERLYDYKLLACEECANSVRLIDGAWHATGLLDTRRRDYVNAGVIFYQSGDEAVRRFLTAWRRLLIDDDSEIPPLLRTNDQDVLNHMLGNPARFAREITFSTTCLRAEVYNCYSRMWAEVWEAGQWENVKILHSWMAPAIADAMQREGFDWSQIFSPEHPYADHIAQFSLSAGAIPPGVKKQLYHLDPKGLVTLRAQLLLAAFLRVQEGPVSVEDRTSLALQTGYSGFETHKPCIDILRNWWSGSDHSPITVIKVGIDYTFDGMGPRNLNEYFRTGYDLEFFDAIFPCRSISAFSRFPFLKYQAGSISSVYCRYDEGLQPSIVDCLDAPDLIIDDDGEVALATRLQNFALLCSRLKAGGLGLLLIPPGQGEPEIPAFDTMLASHGIAASAALYRSDRFAGIQNAWKAFAVTKPTQVESRAKRASVFLGNRLRSSLDRDVQSS
jgi:hypothetical protein